MKAFLKRLPSMFIDPRYFMTISVICSIFMVLDYIMHKNCDVTEFWNCLSFIGITFGIIAGVFIGGNILIRILIVIWNGLKWVWGKLMGAVTL